MEYLTEDEIIEYCGLTIGVTMEHVKAASVLIDAYKGIPFSVVERSERVELVRKRGTDEIRGKLRHCPRIDIQKVTSKIRSAFGVQEIEFPSDCLEFDGTGSKYFTFYMPSSLMFHNTPKNLTVVYHSGFEEIPEEIKKACGIIACNIKQMGGILRWKSRDDYDIKVTLGNDGVMTEEVKQIIDGVYIE